MEEEKDYRVVRKFYIAGVKFHQLRDIVDDLLEGDSLDLEPEPTNKFDPNAVKITCTFNEHTTMCGYVPKKYSAEVTGLLEMGYELDCVITSLNAKAQPWEMCEVEIRELL